MKARRCGSFGTNIGYNVILIRIRRFIGLTVDRRMRVIEARLMVELRLGYIVHIENENI